MVGGGIAYSFLMAMPWEDSFTAVSRSQRWRAILRKQPSALLLAVQIAVILLLPWLQSLA